MNKRPVIVVEGVSDINRLSNMVDADFVAVNGMALSKKTLQYIKELSKDRRIIVLTDPDKSGELIREKLSKNIENLEHLFVDLNKSIKGKKVGVCECDKDELLKVLNNLGIVHVEPVGSLTMNDLIKLKLSGSDNSKSIREVVCKHFKLGNVNGKSMLKRLNMLNIKYEDLEGFINDMF